MRRVLALLVLWLSASLSVAFGQNYTSVTATAIETADGALLPAGLLCFVGTDANDNPIPYQAGGGGQVVSLPACATVANGRIGTFSIANPDNTVPAHVLYRLTVTGPFGRGILYTCKGALLSGSSFNFDSFACPSVVLPPTGGSVNGPLIVNGVLTVTSCTGCFPTAASSPGQSYVSDGSSFLLQSKFLFDPRDYGAKAKADAKYEGDCTFTNTSTTVGCPNGNFTSADVGKVAFGTNLGLANGFGTMLTAVVQVPQGTISSVTDSTHVVVSVAATASNAGSGTFVWGTDDTAAYKSTITAQLSACGTLLIPGKSIIQSGLLNSGGACLHSVGGASGGLGVIGFNPQISQLIPTPSFDFSSCTGANNSCFFGIGDGIFAQDWEIFGAGVSNPSASGAGKSVLSFSALNNGYVNDVKCVGWGANAGANGITIGIVLSGGLADVKFVHPEEDGCGQTGYKMQGGDIATLGLAAYDNPFGCLWISSTGGAGGAGFVSHQSLTGNCGGGTSCAVGVTGGSIWHSIGDNLGGSSGGGSTNQGVCVGAMTTFSGTTTSSGNTVYLDHSQLWGGVNSGGSTAVLVGATDTLHANGTMFGSTASIASVRAIASGGQFFDDCGNTFTAPMFSGSGAVVGDCSITGPPAATGNFALTSGWSSSTKGSFTGKTKDGGLTITLAGSPSSGAVLTLTFPTPFLAPPSHCNWVETNGTQALSSVTTLSISSTAVAYTFNGSLSASNTITGYSNCGNA